jgi:prepilin-type N-terminal cleavage/methylation domain-containing protein
MRKAFSLVEMITVVAVLPMFLALVSPVFMLFIRDIPKSTQLVLEQTVVQQALDRIQQDVDEGKALPRLYGQWSSDERTLLIDKEAEGLVIYRFGDGEMTRAELGPGGGPPRPVGKWALPKTSIRWDLWGQGANAFAVEVHSHMIYRPRSRVQERLANTHVFFLIHAPKEVTP